MRLERRRHFRQPVGMAARVRLAGASPTAVVRARADDLSPAGAMLHMEESPGWGLDLAARKLELELELDLGEFGELHCRAQIRRAVAGDSGCRLGVEFKKMSGDGARRLRRCLDATAECEDDEAIRGRRRTHIRRRRMRVTLVAGLFLAVAAGLTVSLLGLAEAFPKWFGRARSAIGDIIRSEIRDAARQADDDEAHRLRDSPDGSRHDPNDPYDSGGTGDPDAPRDPYGLRNLLTPEERARIKQELGEERRNRED